MHNLERFGFRSDCFSLKDNLNYMSSAFPGPKPCFNHQLCCHGPLTPVPGPQVTSSGIPLQGNGSQVQLQPLQQCVQLLLSSSLQHMKDGNPVAYKQERRTSTILPSHSPAAMKNCFISAAFVLLLCKNPSDCVVSDIKKAQKQRRSFPDSSQRLLCHMAVQRNSVLMGSCYKWRE